MPLTKRKDSAEIRPFSLQPSREFAGNDGKWSTFVVNAGSPPQQFHVLVSTSSLTTWLVSHSACDKTKDETVLFFPDCHKMRGSTSNDGWEIDTSRTYDDLGIRVLQANDDFELQDVYGSSPASHNYSGVAFNSNCSLGRDKLELLSNSQNQAQVSVNETIIFSVEDPSFWVGSLGIAEGGLKLEGDTNTFPTLLSSLANSSVIPSQAWGYTAGSYHNNSFGSLVLGGFDAARISEPVDNFFMQKRRGGEFHQLEVAVESITVEYANSDVISITKTGAETTTFKAVIDSTLPYLYLPHAVCDKFEKTLGLQFDNKTGLYLINDTQRASNSEAAIRIIVADVSTGMKTSKDIVLPYGAFDLNASWPMYDKPTSYFPIRRSPDTSADAMHILGRTFLQGAYIIADFGLNNFTVGQAVAPQDDIQVLVPIFPDDAGDSSSRLNGGSIAGIVVAVVVVVIAITVVAWGLERHKKHKSDQKLPSHQESGSLSAHPAPKFFGAELPGGLSNHQRHVSELSASTAPTAVEAPGEETRHELGNTHLDAVERYELHGDMPMRRERRPYSINSLSTPEIVVKDSNH